MRAILTREALEIMRAIVIREALEIMRAIVIREALPLARGRVTFSILAQRISSYSLFLVLLAEI
jgi:hypothetical protein